MLQVSDVRETRVFQEALEEGLEEGLEKGLEAMARVVLKMLAKEQSIAEIAEITGLTPAQIRQIKKKHQQ